MTVPDRVEEQMSMDLEMVVNGKRVRARVAAHTLLLDFLREELGLSGAKRSCDVEVCGACTVLVDGLPVSACTYLAFEADGKEVTTIEGLGDEKNLHPLQTAFIDCGGFQCGFCTPGFILSAKALLDGNPNPTRDEIKHYLQGNICRCTGYQMILDSVETAAKHIRGETRE